ncbi:uncharacterized protein LOC108846773 isoform X2 [Raphanus sativus]|uniref:Uncharacterized protein LOC108846773 isoform X2 n=1 Tax=Raphanus sativus TaxID=3726 RepID=A0A9W3DBP7_RAPSA|nr:uncharacterized protein LOC108846773 isoform X2 [Raphanus sativus]
MAATGPVNQNWDFSCNMDVDFETDQHAFIAYKALSVDKEPDKVRRAMSVSNNKLSVNFEAIEARLLRASFSAFVDVLSLATRTVQEFGQD